MVPITPEAADMTIEPPSDPNQQKIRSFRTKTKASMEESKFYLEATGYDLELSLQEWEKDNTWDQTEVTRPMQRSVEYTPPSRPKTGRTKKDDWVHHSRLCIYDNRILMTHFNRDCPLQKCQVENFQVELAMDTIWIA